MKKIILLVLLFFNLIPYIEKGTFTFGGPANALAQYGNEYDPDDPTDIVPDGSFDSFLDYIRGSGYQTSGSHHTTIRVGGSSYGGTMVNVYQDDVHVTGYFQPDVSTQVFPDINSHYSVGNEEPSNYYSDYGDPVYGYGYGWDWDWGWGESDNGYDSGNDPYYYDDPDDYYYVGAAPPIVNPGTPPTGNKQPVVVPATPESTANADKVSTIYNGIKNNANFIDMKGKSTNSATNAYESGMSVTKSGTTYGDLNYINGNSSTNVSIPTSDPNHTVVAGVHTHTPGKMAAPSPKDIYHLIKGNKDNLNYTTDIVLAADGSEYAIVISDRAKAFAFLTKYPESTTLNGNAWAGTDRDESKPFYMFNVYLKVLVSEGYSITDANIYAMVYMMADLKYDMGIKLLKKNNGTFKQLDTNPYRDSNGRIHLGVKISN